MENAENTKYVGPKKDMPRLELKHLIWILGWAQDRCADSIGRAELDRARHIANQEHPQACTQYGYKDRVQELARLNASLVEYRTIYAWIIGAMAQAREKDAEDFAQSIAEMFRKRKK